MSQVSVQALHMHVLSSSDDENEANWEGEEELTEAQVKRFCNLQTPECC